MGRRHGKSSEVKLNLAAMLDMAFQLLAFFVLTFKPDPVEGQIMLRLPPPEAVMDPQAKAKAGQDKNNTNPVEGIESLIITIASNGSGSIETILVGDGEIGRDVRVLDIKLENLLKDKDLLFKQVILQVGSKLRYDELMKVIDVCTKQKLPDGSQLSKLSFVELPEGAAGAP